MRVQCKGSGQYARTGVNAKRAFCPNCGTEKDLAANGNFKKHMRVVTKKQLRRM
jgi:ribosomal protein S27AE